MDLEPDSLKDGAKAFMPGEDEDRIGVYEGEHQRALTFESVSGTNGSAVLSLNQDWEPLQAPKIRAMSWSRSGATRHHVHRPRRSPVINPASARMRV